MDWKLLKKLNNRVMGMTKTKEERDFLPINIAVLTVSDTRGIEDDKSGNP